MLIIALLFICIFIHVISDTDINDKITILGYSPKHFYVSNGKSYEMFHKMKSNGIIDQSLKYFVMKEDKLLELEVKSICSQVSRKVEAFKISDEIKNHFLGYDFSYHGKHLKQISEPEKIINQNIKCS
tara:strand:- start:412 stop:795 length:384 start_codon:yes stop_codon:yes gene_type:complete